MKIFSWMRNKRNGTEVTNKPNTNPSSYHYMHESCKEEFSDWPNGLLAIGTFGNNSNHLKQSEKPSNQEDDHHDVDRTELGDDDDDYQKELRLLLNKHMISVDQKHNIPAVEELLDCLYGTDTTVSENKENNHVLQRATSIVHRGRKDRIRSDSHKKGIGKKSLTFLIKKAFLCRGGFVPAAPLPDPKLDHSRMDKILRAMLHKKIYPQRPTTPRKYLDMPENINGDDHDDDYEEGSHESKWVKTDSEYIVLEI